MFTKSLDKLSLDFSVSKIKSDVYITHPKPIAELMDEMIGVCNNIYPDIFYNEFRTGCKLQKRISRVW